MGALIEGDPRRERTYTIAEVSAATGIRRNTLHSRRNMLGIPATRVYTYDQVKQMVKSPARRNKVIAGNVDRLKKQLKEDGML